MIRPHRLAALVSSAILLGLFASFARAEAPSTPAPAPARPRIGLVLSGGGARGAAHIGVLRVLEQRRVPIDCIAGTSMGALVGGLYATGLTADDLEHIVTGIDWSRAFSDRVPRRDRSFHRKRDDDLVLIGSRPGIRRGALRFPPGLIDGQHVDLLLARHTLPVATVSDFDSLAIPYRAVAADVLNGDALVLARGPLALAMRSSMAIPAVFAPREVDGRLLVDGGISENLPIAVARAMGADVLIVVDIGTPPPGREGLGSLVAITTQLMTLMSERSRARDLLTLGERDVFIRPDLGDITTASFDRVAEAVPVGARAAEAVAPRLDALALPPAEYAAWRAARSHPSAHPVIDTVRIVNRSPIGDDVLAARLAVPTGVPLDADAIERACDRVIGLDLFESVGYDIERRSGRNVLTLTARERSWGPDYLQAGVAAFEDFEGPDFELSLALTRTAMNRRAGEWRTIVSMGRDPAVETELHQPLDRALRWFVQARLSARDQAVNDFDAGGDKRSELEARRVAGEFAAGRELGSWGEARVGILRESGDLGTRVGEHVIADRALATGDLHGGLAVDRLDDLDFPRAGYRLGARCTAGLRSLGSAAAYRQLATHAAVAGSRGRWSALMSGSVATTVSGSPPLQAEYALGGFARLSGLQYDERHGANTALASVVAYRRLNDIAVLPVYGGLSAEYGGVFARRREMRIGDGIASGSAFLGIKSLLGPIVVAYARAEGGRSNYYLSLGETFHLRRTGLWRH